MTASPPPRRVVPALAAAAGVVAAHAVDYLVVFPSAGSRSAHLEATGHADWPVVATAGMVAASFAVILAAVGGAALGLRTGRTNRGIAHRLGSLLAWQAGAFAALELAERTVAGVPPSMLLASPELWLGLLLQVPVALLSLRLLGLVERAALRLVTSLRVSTPRCRPSLFVPAPAVPRLGSGVTSRPLPRAPPLPSRA